MKDSIFYVPIAEDFIDLEHLLRIGSITFHSTYEHVSVELKYMFRKESELITVRARDLFDAEEMKRYDGYRITAPAFAIVGNELGRKFEKDTIAAFDMKVRLPIYEAWKAYRESKTK